MQRTLQLTKKQTSRSHSGRVLSGLGERFCGANKISVTKGHIKAWMTGDKNMPQPGNGLPELIRSVSSIKWPTINKGNTCKD